VSAQAVQTGVIRTKIPSRLDRLPWGRFHWLVILGLGTAWVLDGLEVTIVGTVGPRMAEHGSGISISVAQVGTAGSVYIAGACLGALLFGQLTDRFGRKKLFLWTLGLYLLATAATGVAFNAWYFYGARFLTGAGIGGEYAAINSAIDELIPARARGRVDLIVNGSYWLGSIGGSAASIVFLNTAWFPKDLGWRLTFVLGVILAIAVLLVRRHVPESPRWLFIHGRQEEAERIVGDIEDGIEREGGESLRPVSRELTVRQRKTIPFREIAKVAVKRYPRRSLLALALFVGQAFIYNGITFNLGTLMTTFFKVSSGFVPVFVILYAVANFLGPLTIGRLFDTFGRKPMIAGTYLGSAVLGVVLGLLFFGRLLNRWTFIAVLMGTFFLASAGASAAYLTASEIFPMETRALAIAFFYAIGTAVGGITGPLLFSGLIGSGKVGEVVIAFYLGAAVMAVGGVVEAFWGIKAEGRQLEDLATPLTVEDAQAQEAGDGRVGAGSPSASESARGGDGGDGGARAARAQAARERASAAEHRAAMHSRLAEASEGDAQARDRADDEDIMAQAADLLAGAFDEEAAAAEQDGQAASAPGPRAAAARHRAVAARTRARALRIEAAALAPDTPAEGERGRAFADAARENALAHEQFAQAELAGEPRDGEARDGEPRDGEARGEVAGGGELTRALAHMHVMWALAHEARARLIEARAEGSDAAEEARQADAAAERARAAEASVEAAEQRAEARQEDQAAQTAQAAQAASERAERLAQEERIRARLERHRDRDRGLRRLAPGPGRLLGGSPAISAPAPAVPELLDHEIQAIARALGEHGPTQRPELARLVGARFWGPGVFRRALAEAVGDGLVRRVGRDTYAGNGDGQSAEADG
jgi:MFS family permease